MNIFIAGLNYNMSEAELGELFAEYGEVVSVKIIMDRETGRSKGYGFVEMADDEAGDKAIAALNEVDMDGKTLSVSVARPREERPRRSYGNMYLANLHTSFLCNLIYPTFSRILLYSC